MKAINYYLPLLKGTALCIIFLGCFGGTSVHAQKKWGVKLLTDYSMVTETMDFEADYHQERSKTINHNLLYFFEVERRINKNFRASIFTGYGSESYSLNYNGYYLLEKTNVKLQNVLAGGSLGVMMGEYVAFYVSYHKNFITPTITEGKLTVRNDGRIENLQGKKLNTVDGDVFMLKLEISQPISKDLQAMVSVGQRFHLHENVIEEVLIKSEAAWFLQAGFRYNIF